MTAIAAQLTEQALTLSENERAELAHKLLLSLDEESAEGVDQAWDEEAEMRLERVKNGTAQGRPAEEVLKDIRARLR